MKNITSLFLLLRSFNVPVETVLFSRDPAQTAYRRQIRLLEAQKARNAWWKRQAIGCSLVLVIGMTVAYAALSPYLCLSGMRDAATAKDGKKFATYIDFPVFKENLKSEMNVSMLSEMAKDQKTKDNPFAGLGMALAPAIVNNLVDAIITPAGVEKMMSGDFMPKSLGGNVPTSGTVGNQNPFTNLTADNAHFSYESLMEFHVRIINPDGRVTTLIFERHWIGDWRLVNLKPPI